LIWYDVRSCLSYGGSTLYSDPNYTAIFGELESWKLPAAASLPLEFSMEAFPNPFNPSTRILYSLKTGGAIKLAISDITGREVQSLIDEQRSAGRYSVVWNGANQEGQQVGTGVYFARIVVSDEYGHVAHTQTVRLLLMK